MVSTSTCLVVVAVGLLVNILQPALCAVPLENFFPYGGTDDTVFPYTNGGIDPVTLTVPFKLFGVQHDVLSATENGFIYIGDFNQYPPWDAPCQPFYVPAIGPFINEAST